MLGAEPLPNCVRCKVRPPGGGQANRWLSNKPSLTEFQEVRCQIGADEDETCWDETCRDERARKIAKHRPQSEEPE